MGVFAVLVSLPIDLCDSDIVLSPTAKLYGNQLLASKKICMGDRASGSDRHDWSRLRVPAWPKYRLGSADSRFCFWKGWLDSLNNNGCCRPDFYLGSLRRSEELLSALVLGIFIVSLLFLLLSREQIGVGVYLKLSMDALAVFLVGIQGKMETSILKFASLFLVFMSLLLSVLIVVSTSSRGSNDPSQ